MGRGMAEEVEKPGAELVTRDGLCFRRTDLGLVFVPRYRAGGRKHMCPDCAECALCSDARCDACREKRGEEKGQGRGA